MLVRYWTSTVLTHFLTFFQISSTFSTLFNFFHLDFAIGTKFFPRLMFTLVFAFRHPTVLLSSHSRISTLNFPFHHNLSYWKFWLERSECFRRRRSCIAKLSQNCDKSILLLAHELSSKCRVLNKSGMLFLSSPPNWKQHPDWDEFPVLENPTRLVGCVMCSFFHILLINAFSFKML